jgi:hypothetical protein
VSFRFLFIVAPTKLMLDVPQRRADLIEASLGLIEGQVVRHPIMRVVRAGRFAPLVE